MGSQHASSNNNVLPTSTPPFGSPKSFRGTNQVVELPTLISRKYDPVHNTQTY